MGMSCPKSRTHLQPRHIGGGSRLRASYPGVGETMSTDRPMNVCVTRIRMSAWCKWQQATRSHRWQRRWQRRPRRFRRWQRRPRRSRRPRRQRRPRWCCRSRRLAYGVSPRSPAVRRPRKPAKPAKPTKAASAYKSHFFSGRPCWGSLDRVAQTSTTMPITMSGSERSWPIVTQPPNR